MDQRCNSVDLWISTKNLCKIMRPFALGAVVVLAFIASIGMLIYNFKYYKVSSAKTKTVWIDRIWCEKVYILVVNGLSVVDFAMKLFSWITLVFRDVFPFHRFIICLCYACMAQCFCDEIWLIVFWIEFFQLFNFLRKSFFVRQKIVHRSVT